MRYFRGICITICGLLALTGAAGSRAQGSAPASQNVAQPAPHLDGTYSGTLQAGEAQLHIVLHLSKNSVGALQATLDSLDQAVFGIEANSVTLNFGVLKFDVRSVGVTFEGQVSADTKTIDGEWRQGSNALPLAFHVEPAARKPEGAKSPVEGLWQAAFEANGLRLRFQLHVSHGPDGQLIAALDSLDQFVSGLPAAKVSQKDNSFHFEIPALQSSYDGTLDLTKSAINGEWSQSDIKQKLDFQRSDQPLELRRPQTPAKPYPYREEDVTFENQKAAVSLSGTLTLPKGAGPFPAAVLIAGSGPEDRDGAIANHKPFLVLADFLTRNGMAVLRYDKRGVGQSTGSLEMATTMDLASDAQCALNYMKSRKDIDPAKTGLIGHSEGAMIAPSVAVSVHDVSWLVLLAAPGTKGEDTLLNQSDLIARAGGLSDAQVLASLNFDKEAYDLLQKEDDSQALMEKLKALVKESGLDTALPPAALESQLHMMMSPWFRYFLSYDPLPDLKKTKCPVLALYGQKDLQVPPKINVPLVQKAFADGGNGHAEVRQLPDLNHLFQHAYTGSPTEYAAIDETFSPAALQMIGDWLAAQNKMK
ncbi:MAG TPA: alpha/beta hydrolase [Verrucomicrobiae bacterium]|nr:alpha/beta hydrolase [Verrucomicrobiae bacterium]